ncbi:glycosyltransferase [Heliorestis convoluta]|uniref:Glycosyl transferases group family 1 protein n=1 Tax=Heliorestis convoluta TaxID=356322 RepID=A0A5Q2N3Z6_9FIRM|nr:glycosyltransferase [Heliorestis convoluta]QGG47305.1 glycosyl transferases group family 1 protein [Heliorestis convoluta]
MKKVLILSAFIPHYREKLIKQFAQKCSLTVTSLELEKLNHIAPKSEIEKYCNLIKTKSLNFFEKILKIYIVPKEINLSVKQEWDTVFAFYSLRYPHRLFIFMWYKSFKKKTNWVWVGHIYGRNNMFLVKLLRRFFLNNSNGVLTYTNEYVEKLKSDGINVPIFSFNNTYLSADDIEVLPIEKINNKLNIIFVGRYQKRKKIERLIYLAKRREDVCIRLIGPGMDVLEEKILEYGLSERISTFGSKIGDELKPHFQWAHIVANPGHVGLLVVTAGQFGRPIVIDNQCEHAPEYIIAKETGQFFINWENNEEVDKIIDLYKSSPSIITNMGKDLSELIKKQYTVENSVKSFRRFI